MATPADFYDPSPRPFTESPEPIEYPGHFEIRRVSADSTLRWHSRKVVFSNLLKYHDVGLDQVGDGVWSVYFGPVHLGWLDETDYRIMDVKDRARRRRSSVNHQPRTICKPSASTVHVPAFVDQPRLGAVEKTMYQLGSALNGLMGHRPHQRLDTRIAV